MESLLPISATEQERSLESVMRSDAFIAALVERIASVKEEPEDGWLMWLIWEYGLEEILPYLTNPRVAIEQGLDWQRIKGTPESLRRVLEWIGMPNAFIENEETGSRHWHEFQIDPGLIPGTALDIEKIKQAAKISAPVGTRLARIYHGYDVRRMILSDSDYGALLSDYSGVRDADGVRLSFGRTHTLELTGFECTADMIIVRNHVRVDRYDDKALLDFSKWEDIAILNLPCRHRQTRRHVTGTNGLTGWSDSYWPDASWSDVSSIVDVVHSRDYRVYKFDVVYESRPWSDQPWIDITWNDFNVETWTRHTRSS